MRKLSFKVFTIVISTPVRPITHDLFIPIVFRHLTLKEQQQQHGRVYHNGQVQKGLFSSLINVWIFEVQIALPLGLNLKG